MTTSPLAAPAAAPERRLSLGSLARATPAWAITAVLGLAYVIAAPPSTDLAAAAYRSDLFARTGLVLWDNGWYGGHHLLAYSLLAPALGALIGPQLLAALSMTLATALFTALIEGRFSARATRVASIWFALGAGLALLANRVPFDLGLAIGLGSLLVAQSARGRPRRCALALLLAVLCAVASPVAGAFLALAALAWALAQRSAGGRWLPLALALAALAPIAALALVFPEGGTQPFGASAFYPALAGVLLIAALIEPEHRVLRIGALLYAAALIGAYAIASPVGGNADRLGALLAGPLAACVLIGSSSRMRRLMLLALAPALLYWQANAPVTDFASAASNPAVHASYYAPLLDELQRLHIGYGAQPARIEVVPTVDHFEARFLGLRVALARGWERQLDLGRDGLFYDEGSTLSATRYRSWLSQQSVSYVALPDAPLDYSAGAEARLLRGQSTAGALPGYLHEVWRSAHWRLFAVRGAAPLAQAPAVLASLGSDSFTLRLPQAGAYTVRVHFTPYWALASGSGCVSRAPGDWTRVQVRSAGSARVVIDFSLARVFDQGPRCN
jgi:hypothetical protein